MVSETVGVELLSDGRILRLPLFVLVEDPFKRAAVAEPVLPVFGRDACEDRPGVDEDAARVLVGPQHYPPRRTGFLRVLIDPAGALQLRRGDLLVAEVKVQQFLAPVGPCPEV